MYTPSPLTQQMTSYGPELAKWPFFWRAQSKLEDGKVLNRMLNIKPENAAKRAIMAMAKVRKCNEQPSD